MINSPTITERLLFQTPYTIRTGIPADQCVARLHYIVTYGIPRGQKVKLAVQQHDDGYDLQLAVLRDVSNRVFYTHTRGDVHLTQDMQTGEAVIQGVSRFGGWYTTFVAALTLLGLLLLLAGNISFLFTLAGIVVLGTAFVHWSGLFIDRQSLIMLVNDTATAERTIYEDFWEQYPDMKEQPV